MKTNKNELETIVLHQLNSFWANIDTEKIHEAFLRTWDSSRESFKYLGWDLNDEDYYINPYHSVSWAIFLYKLSHELGTNNVYRDIADKEPKEADMVYYLNKIMNGNDWYHQIELPIHFMCEHVIGSVLGRAKYGDYFMVYQWVTVGGNRSRNGIIEYPLIGKNVLLYANATVIGSTSIGNNVIVSANSYLIDEIVPDNSIVFGISPNIRIIEKSKREIMKMTEHIWKWE